MLTEPGIQCADSQRADLSALWLPECIYAEKARVLQILSAFLNTS